MKLFRCFLVYFFFVTVFLLTLSLKPWLAGSTKTSNLFDHSSYSILEKIVRETTLDFQMQEKFALLRHEIFDNFETFFHENHAEKYFSDYISSYTLGVVLSDKSGNLIKTQFMKGTIEERLLELFLKFDYIAINREKERAPLEKVILSLYSNLPEEELSQLKPNTEAYNRKLAEYQALIALEENELNSLLSVFFGNKTASIRYLQARNSKFTINDSTDGSTYFYWDKYQTPEQNIYFLMLFNPVDLDSSFPQKSFLEGCNHTDKKLGFINIKTGKWVAPDDTIAFVKKHVHLDFSKIIKTDIDKIELFKLDGFSLILGGKLLSSDYRPIIIALENIKDNGKNIKLFLLILISICLIFVVETVVFSRGFYINVARALIVTIILATMMPFLMGHSVFSLILQEASESERLRLSRQVHNTLRGIDSGIRLFQANLFHNLKKIVGKDEIKQRMLKEYQLEQEEFNGKSGDKIYDDKLLTDISDGLFESEIKKISESFSIESFPKLLLFGIFGPHGFSRTIEKFDGRRQRNSQEVTLIDEHNLVILVVRLLMGAWKYATPKESFLADFREVDQAQELVLEEAKKELSKSFGEKNSYRILSNYNKLVFQSSGHGNTYMNIFPVYFNGLIALFSGFASDDNVLGPIYYRVAQHNLEAQPKIEKPFLYSYFEDTIPNLRLTESPTAFQAMEYRLRTTIYTGEKCPYIATLIRKVLQNKSVMRELKTSGKKAILEVHPGRYGSSFTIGARQDIDHLKNLELIRSMILLLGMAIFILLALFASKNICHSFTSPLDHLLWGLGRVEKEDYSTKLRASREDELGSISRSFNQMVKGLQERITLETFVSPSVKKLVADPVLFEKTKLGIEEEVTVVFADLKGLSDLIDSGDEANIQSALEFALSIFHKKATKYDVEINKVIGEKILIFFTHTDVTGERQCSRLACHLVKEIIAEFEGSNLKPVFGINNGKIISTIIGATSSTDKILKSNLDKTIIGDPVNVAARLCALANPRNAKVVISGGIRKNVFKKEKCVKMDVDKVRGKKQVVDVYKLKI